VIHSLIIVCNIVRWWEVDGDASALLPSDSFDELSDGNSDYFVRSIITRRAILSHV